VNQKYKTYQGETFLPWHELKILMQKTEGFSFDFGFGSQAKLYFFSQSATYLA